MRAGQSEKHHCRCFSAGDNEERLRLMSRRYTRSAVWRRGWVFEVAFAEALTLLLRGPAPSYAPHAGEPFPRGPSCSNPTLSLLSFRAMDF